MGVQTILAACITLCSAKAIVVVNLTHGVDSGSVHVAAFAAAGLENRDGPKVYVTRDDDGTSDGALAPRVPSRTAFWLNELIAGKHNLQVMKPLEFLNASVHRHGVIRYSSDVGEAFTAVLTLAGVHGAIPLDETLMPLFPAAQVKFDTVARWQSEEDAIDEVANTVLQNTTALAINKMSDLTSGKLVDWIVHQKLFVIGLKNMCIPFTRNHRRLKDILASSPWPRPVKVYGYNHDGVPLVAPDVSVFEAETNCVKELAAIVSGGTANLPFWSNFEPLGPAERMTQPAQGPIVYNASRTYAALLMSDMDNFDFVQGDGFRSMQQRVELCGGGKRCPPLTWTMQPALATMSPAMMRWYYDKLHKTGGQDSFVLPPSGALYAYPSEFPTGLQAQYAEMTNDAAAVLNASGTAHWELVGSWLAAERDYFPLFAQGTGRVKVFMLDQVPYMLPLPALGFDDVKVIGDASSDESVVLVRPAFSVAAGGTWDDQKKGQYPADIARKLSSLKRGDVTYVYCITGTSAPMAALKEMSELLEEHVEIVGYEQLGSLARQKELHRMSVQV